jgi:UDP-N-acetylmuramoyl-L-alanyl-D-glutamate--2,6-diaminopimelate ligase
MESYFNEKLKLFTEHLTHSNSRWGKVAVLNVADPWGRRIEQRWKGKKITYSIDESPCDVDVHPEQIDDMGFEGMRITLKTPMGKMELSTGLFGKFNIQNICAAVATSVAMGFRPDCIAEGIRRLNQVSGRLQKVSLCGGPDVFVDFAHTPSALESVLGSLKPHARGKLVVIFGCGGDRDREKRPIMGRVASELADFVIITTDNPRSEDPLSIIGSIKQGVLSAGMKELSRSDGIQNGCFCTIPDRADAIRFAINAANPEDTILIAGKGHEKYQVVGQRKVMFSDVKVASAALEERVSKS